MGIFSKKATPPLPVVQIPRESESIISPLKIVSQSITPQLRLYSAIRESVPVVDAAITKIARLCGGFRVTCEDKSAQKALDRFLESVPVGLGGVGISAFVTSYLEQLLTFGTAIGEIVPDRFQSGIAGLFNTNLEQVELSAGENPFCPAIGRRDGLTYVPVRYPELILLSVNNPDPGSVYGNSILKGLPFVSSVLMKIFNTIGVNWERVGNLRFAVTYNPQGDGSERAFARDRANMIAEEWSKAMRNDSGQVRDFVAVGDVSIKVIGADNQILDSEIPVRQMLEQLVAKLGIPPFLLGLHWSSTERMASQQADILTSELEGYRRILNPVIKKICRFWLALNNYGTDVEIDWDNINLQDEVELAKARLIRAQAAQIEEKLENNLEKN